MTESNYIYRLKGRVQHYDWGGLLYIPTLLNIENHEKKPHAEYWLGDHRSAPSLVIQDDRSESLRELIRQNPTKILGWDVQSKFGDQLPFLLKILDVKGMLSLQIHPDKPAAQMGYEIEDKAQIPTDSPERTFKDKNHKPEMMIALSDFWLFHGFCSFAEARRNLSDILDSDHLSIVSARNIEELYRNLVTLEDAVFESATDRLFSFHAMNSYPKTAHHFWVKKIVSSLASDWRNLDRSIFTLYLLNLVHLKSGEAIYQGPGIIHAYLEGQNIEVMASSDNVMRGGLTKKHVNLDLLMKHMIFDESKPHLISGIGIDCGVRFRPPVDDFILERYTFSRGDMYTMDAVAGPQIWLIMAGKITVGSDCYSQGEAYLIATNKVFEIECQETTDAIRVMVAQ